VSILSYHAPPATGVYTLSLHDALPIWARARGARARLLLHRLVRRVGGVGGHGHRNPDAMGRRGSRRASGGARAHETQGCDAHARSEEHTSELQSRSDLVCRLLLEKKKK